MMILEGVEEGAEGEKRRGWEQGKGGGCRDVMIISVVKEAEGRGGVGLGLEMKNEGEQLISCHFGLQRSE